MTCGLSLKPSGLKTPASVSPETEQTPASTDRASLTIAGARVLGRQRLAGLSDTVDLDADLILQHATGLRRTDLITRSSEPVGAEAGDRYVGLLERRAAGEPVAYITGRKHFRSIELFVDRRVLVPRPETDLLVEIGLLALQERTGTRRVIDVGTGSGAIALALASELNDLGRGDVDVVAGDISQDALDVASRSRNALGLDGRVELIKSDLLGSVIGRFDLILANLPYLRTNQCHHSTASEPAQALYAGADGLDEYRRLLPQAAGHLEPDGVLACEINPSQEGEMRRLLSEHIQGDVAVLRDLAGWDRIVVSGAVDIVRTVADTWRYGA
ncbi:peptide chain release factor N(5)-glutamine methyltransferase [soil metagenome]